MCKEHILRYLDSYSVFHYYHYFFSVHPLLSQCMPHGRNFFIIWQNIGKWTKRCDLKPVNLSVALRIVILDMLELRCFPKRSVSPIQVPHPLMQKWVSRSNVANVALEVLNIYWVEANDCGIEADVCFGRSRGREEVGCRGFGEELLDTVEGVE